MKGTFYIFPENLNYHQDCATSVTVGNKTVVLKQGNDIIALDVKQIKQLINELTGEFK